MPRRQFIADLQQTRDGVLPPGINDLKAGEDDGQFVFLYGNDIYSDPVSITAMISDVSEYPKSHEYMLFCADDAPKRLADKLQTLPRTEGKTVLQLLDIVSGSLSSATSGASSSASVPSLVDDDEYDGEEEEEYMGDDDDDFLVSATSHTKQTRVEPGQSSRAGASNGFNGTSKSYRNRVRNDLQAVKDAGFRVSVFGNILGAANCYVTISLRISKLGLSEEAMQAWQIHPEEYLMLVIHYPAGYQSHEQIQTAKRHKEFASFGMRVFCSPTHKPLLQDTIRAFQAPRSDTHLDPTRVDDQEGATTTSIRNTFISKPLITLLEDHLVQVLRFRSSGMDWHGAEMFFQELREGHVGDHAHEAGTRHYEPEPRNYALPTIVSNDHLTTPGIQEYSFPLLATQFMLRHFVRCVEFCLVCHRKIDSKIEAIKPYVCDRPLCLFQYMAMGFGPSIEHEIQSQPWVVDLLICFCYSSAAARRLKELPTGLGITVPGVSTYASNPSRQSYYHLNMTYIEEPVEEPKPALVSKEFSVTFDRERLELTFFEKQAGGCPVVRGQWIVIKNGTKVNGAGSELHCRVKETSFYPTITVDEPILAENDWARQQEMCSSAKKSNPAPKPTSAQKVTSTTFVRYDQEFDDLDHAAKCQTVCRLLDLLPSVHDMAQWLDRSPYNDLKRWHERIPVATLNLLRWIIASNRACIMQVDGMSAVKDTEGKEIRKAFKQDRLFGMRDYVQFRFAMGAPDKEERFLTAVRETTRRLNLKYPTIFAWHGSPLYNWHMIIREGLHFKRADHGRAYGDGVYHARDAQTSLGYTGLYRAENPSSNSWVNSGLNISSALALNELVNAPAEFQSNNPYYVVKQLDWIQTRYLLVKCALTVPLPAEVPPKSQHPQDPDRTPTGFSSKIMIPASAIKSGRAQTGTRQGASKKLKGTNGDPIILDGEDEYKSDESEAEDREILQPEIEAQPDSQSLPLVGSKQSKTAEDFEPGMLEYSTLPLMPTPAYATNATTRRLMNELTSMEKVLKATTPSELGWYIDLEKVDNVYQWIVELHSFHKLEVKGKRLPLADDMRSKGVKSVVLEIRFGHDFPFSPPYVRVVRPRFKTFMEGGGGHIVAGGAMCMELLTNTGWSGINSMESVLLQVRLAIASEPFARLHPGLQGDYGAGEAAEGFIRACRTHGWVEPPGFREIAYGKM